VALSTGARAVERSPLRIRSQPLSGLLGAHPLGFGFGAYLLAAVVLTLPVWADPAGRWAGPSGDAQQAMWFLSWTPHAIGQGWNPLTSGLLNAPVGVNLTWDTFMPLPGLLLAPVTLTLGPVVAYNVLVTVGVALCGVSAMAALRRYVASPAAALAGGALYALGPFAVGQVAGHPNLVAAAAILPLVLLVLDRLVRGDIGVMRGGIALGGLGALELVVWEETLATTALAAAVLLAVLAAHRPAEVRAAMRRLSGALALGLVVAAPVAVPFLLQQFLGAGTVHGGIQARGFFVTDLLNPIVPTRTALVSPAPLASISDGFTGNILENDGYIGLPLLLIAAWTARRWWNDITVRVAALTGAGLLLLSLGPSLHVGGHDTGVPLPWRAIQALPLLGEMLPSRLAQHVDLAVAVLLAVFVQRAVVAAPSSVRRLPRIGLAAAGVLLLPLFPYPTTAATVPAFFSGSGVSRIPQGSTALVVPYAHDPWSSQAMLWQAAAGMRFGMPEGYFIGPGDGDRAYPGPRPTELGDDLAAVAAGMGRPTLDAATRSRLRDQLSAWAVTTVIVGPMAHEDDAVAFVSDVLGRAPESTGGVQVWWGAA
jgi:hypothetical protein